MGDVRAPTGTCIIVPLIVPSRKAIYIVNHGESFKEGDVAWRPS